MKHPVAFFLLIAVLPACRSPRVGLPKAPEATETKIGIMGQALLARDRGDFTTARSRLMELAALVPNDSEVRRLLAAVDAAEAAQQLALTQVPPVVAPPVAPPEISPVGPPSAPRPTPAASPTPSTVLSPQSPPSAGPSTVVRSPSTEPAPPGMMPTVIEERAPGAPPLQPPDAMTQALQRVEMAGADFAQAPASTRVEKLMAYVEAQRALARLYSLDKHNMTAVRTIDATLESIKKLTDELKAERAQYLEQEVKARQGVRMHRNN